LAVVMIVVAALLYIFVVREKATKAVPPPATITITRTASPPTPKAQPSPRESGTAFYDSIPSVLGAYVLTATAENPDWEALGAFDSYVLTYTDGDQEATLRAGQWRTEEAATEAFDSLGGPAAWPGASFDPAATQCPPAPEPDVQALWANQTAVFQIDVANGGAGELFCLMPM
jgi:hypothetical protein